MAPFIYVLCQSQNSLLRMVIYFLKFKHIHNTLTSNQSIFFRQHFFFCLAYIHRLISFYEHISVVLEFSLACAYIYLP